MDPVPKAYHLSGPPRRTGRNWTAASILVALLCWRAAAGEPVPKAATNAILRIQSVKVNTKPVPFRPNTRLTLPAQPQQITIGYGPASNSPALALRIRHKLDGQDEDWREVAGEMRLLVRFLGGNGDQIGESVFLARGQSDGWTGRRDTSDFHQHIEKIKVPRHATAVWVVLTSAGPPNSVGVYWLTNLVVSKTSKGSTDTTIAIPWAFAPSAGPGSPNTAPEGWMRDGLRASMAKAGGAGPLFRVPALGLEDDDVNGHAEWHTLKEAAPKVSPGDVLTLEWADAFSTGLAGPATASYSELPAGFFRFQINGLSLSGEPLLQETSLSLEVPLAAWKTPWFWIAVATGLTGIGVCVWRLADWRRMQRRLWQLEQQRAIEQERLRIAQDIHDDLGARVTQISLFSAVAQKRGSLPAEARGDFGEVSRMARRLVGALYETVWSVNPENDSLDALANYLCQVGNQLCSEAQLRCRLEVPSLPPSIPLTSQVRHNLIMAVKEAVHNVVKHAHATEVRIGISFSRPQLDIFIQDDGRGFDPQDPVAGNGLGNLRRRMQTIGGGFEIVSATGKGTRIRLGLSVPSDPATPRRRNQS